MEQYTTPTVTTLGSLHELTLDFNKIGHTPDVYSSAVPIVGPIVTAS